MSARFQFRHRSCHAAYIKKAGPDYPKLHLPSGGKGKARAALQTTVATLATLALDAMPEVAAWVADY